MTVLLPWLRRGLGPWLFVPMTAFLVWTSVTTHPWHLEFDWGARYLSGALFVFSPLVAAAAAYDVARRAKPQLVDLGLGARRGVVGPLSPGLAVLLWALAACCVGWLTVGLITTLDDGLGPSDPWVFAETLAALGAAAVVGVVVAVLVDGVLAAVVAAGAVIVIASVTSGHGANLFQVASSTGSLIGIERTPARALATVFSHVAIAGSGVGVLTALFSAVSTPRRWMAGVTVTAAAVVAAALVWPFTESEYQPTTGPSACVGSAAVAVCGPASAARLLETPAADLSAARDRLAGSGLVLPVRFHVLRGAAADDLPDDETLLDLDSSALVGGHLPVEVVSTTLATPRLCAAFYSNEAAPEYLDRVGVVRNWVQQALTGEPTTGAAPQEVREAFAALSSCEPR